MERNVNPDKMDGSLFYRIMSSSLLFSTFIFVLMFNQEAFAQTPSGYIKCANENQSYTLSGTCNVAYGANGKFNYKYNQSGTINFNNASFGDPIPGVVKAGYYKSTVNLQNPENPANTVNGLDYKYYHGSWSNIPNFSALIPVRSGTIANFTGTGSMQSDNFGYAFTGYVNIPSDGLYTFYTNSDDGSKLYIGSTLVVNNDGTHAPVEQSGQIGLKAGKHAIKVDFFELSGGDVLNVSYQGTNIAKQLIPSSALYRVQSTPTTYALTVYSGTGSGNYLANATATITANAAASGKVFDKWVANSGSPVIANISASSTTLKMPANATSVTATYKDITGPAGYIWCANENQSYTISGTCDVAYGANGVFNYKYNQIGTVTFNNTSFGDPIPGIAKAGYYKKVTLSINSVYGVYTRLPYLNTWHGGVIEMSGSILQWRNNAGVTWPLIPDLTNNKLLTTSQCPYYNNGTNPFILKVVNNKVVGFTFSNEYYAITTADGNALALEKGNWLIATKAVDGPSNNDLDYLALIAASSALTDGKPSVLAITDNNCLTSQAWHKDYVARFKAKNALVVGLDISAINGASQIIKLNFLSAGVEQAKKIAITVWRSSNQVVVCSADDYQKALTAASLAAKLRVPLLFSTSANPSGLNATLTQLGVKSALVVGVAQTLSVPTTTLYGTSNVIKWLRNNGHTVNYLAVTNIQDRNPHADGSKLSMIAGILAARRGGIVVPVASASSYDALKSELGQLYSAVATGYYPEFLAIVGTPSFIPFANRPNPMGWAADPLLKTDALYGNIDSDHFLEIAIGRIIANDFSEGSLITSRISTYDLLKNGNWEKRFAEMGRWGIVEEAPKLTNAGFSRDDLTGADHSFDASSIEDGIILHYDHSWWRELGTAFNLQMTTLLSPSVIMSMGCSTAALDRQPVQITKQLLRQGAVAYMGGTLNLISMLHQMVGNTTNAIVDNEPLGHAFRRGYEAVSLNVLDNSNDGNSEFARHNWLLIGDPAFVVHTPATPQVKPAYTTISSDRKTLTVTGPSSWWTKAVPDPLLQEWNWYPKKLFIPVGSGVAVTSNWGAPGYDIQTSYYTAKYKTSTALQSVVQQSNVSSPLGWGGSFINNVHIDSHSDGTKTYLWRVRLMNFNHETGIINSKLDNVSYTITGGSRSASVSEETIPQIVELSQNYPNPFNPVTTINFTLPEAGSVKLAIMNAKGENVKVLANGAYQAGNHSFDFNGSGLNSGVYFYQLTTPEKTITKKMMLIK